MLSGDNGALLPWLEFRLTSWPPGSGPRSSRPGSCSVLWHILSERRPHADK